MPCLDERRFDSIALAIRAQARSWTDRTDEFATNADQSLITSVLRADFGAIGFVRRAAPATPEENL